MANQEPTHPINLSILDFKTPPYAVFWVLVTTINLSILDFKTSSKSLKT